MKKKIAPLCTQKRHYNQNYSILSPFHFGKQRRFQLCRRSALKQIPAVNPVRHNGFRYNSSGASSHTNIINFGLSIAPDLAWREDIHFPDAVIGILTPQLSL